MQRKRRKIMNKLTIIGNLTKDPEINKTTAGMDYTKFSVAVQRKFKKDDGTHDVDFFNCTAWGKIGTDVIAKYCKKGDKILDTHLGSASSIIACKKLGFEYLGFELDKEYFDKASERIAKFESQTNLFGILNEQPKPKQNSLF